MLRLLTIATLLPYSDLLVPQETIIVSDDGIEYYLEGYTAYDELSAGISKTFSAKLSQAIKQFFHTPATLQDLSHVEFAFINLLYCLMKNDAIYSNIFLESLSSLNPKSQPIISPSFLSRIKLTADEFYIVMKEVAKGTQRGLISFPNYVAKELIAIDKNYRVFETACAEGDIDVVKWFLENGYEVGPSKKEILLSSWKSSQWNVIKLLLQNGILQEGITMEMTNLTNSNNETILHYVAETNSPSAPISIIKLVTAGININSVDINGCSPLCRALSVNSSLENINALILKGANVDSHSENLLHIAIRNRNIPAIKLLLNKGASINKKNRFGISALQYSEILGLSTVILELQEIILPASEINDPNSVFSALWFSSISYKTLLSGPFVQVSYDNSKLWIESLTVLTRLLFHNKVSNFTFIKEKVSLLKLFITYGQNSVIAVQYLLGTVSNPRETIDENMFLHIAASKGNKNIVNLLLKIGCSVNLRSSDSKTALYEAAYQGYKHIVILLLENKANVNISTNEGLTPLHAASQNGHLDIVKILVSWHADIMARSVYGDNPLHAAIKSNKPAVIEYLLSKNASITYNDKIIASNIPASNIKETDPLRGNANHSAYSKVPQNELWILLDSLVRKGDINAIRDIIFTGVDINIKNDDGWSILHTAVSEKQLTIADTLIRSNADVNSSTNNGYTVLHLAAKVALMPIVSKLIDNGAFVNAQTLEGWSVLHSAVEGNDSKIIQLLLISGADINTANTDGWTPLHEAIEKGEINIAKLLVENGADINVKNKDSWSILHFTVEKNDISLVQLLLDAKANVNSQNKDGWSVLHEAVSNNLTNISKLLLDRGANPNIASNTDWTALLEAAEKGFVDIVNELIFHHADVNKGLSNGWSPLHAASEHGHFQIVQILIKHCADIMKKSNTSIPYEIALENGHKFIASYLKEQESSNVCGDHKQRLI